jgi:cation transport protein ChaC
VVTREGALTAVTYVADRAHAQYAGKLPPEKIVAAIRQGVGIAGTNIDYLANTVCHLDELGIVDGPLHRLLRLVQGKD